MKSFNKGLLVPNMYPKGFHKIQRKGTGEGRKRFSGTLWSLKNCRPHQPARPWVPLEGPGEPIELTFSGHPLSGPVTGHSPGLLSSARKWAVCIIENILPSWLFVFCLGLEWFLPCRLFIFYIVKFSNFFMVVIFFFHISLVFSSVLCYGVSYDFFPISFFLW